MLNTNTFELFKQTDPEKFIDLLGKYLIESIKSGAAIREPWRLSLFLMLSFSDLKKYKFYYWVAHPTPYNLSETYYQRNPKPIGDEFTSSQIEEMQAGFLQLDSKSKSFFSLFVSTENNSLKVTSLAEGIEFVQSLNLDSTKSVSFSIE